MTSTAQKPKVLVVDDEAQITRVLRASLVSEGYDVGVANDGELGLRRMQEFSPDIIITDLSMPNMGGIAFCREVRKQSDIPILVLSVKQEEEMKVAALDAGADDYVTKPFGINELLARLRAALRRRSAVRPHSNVIEMGHFKIDREARRVWVQAREVRLTPKEYELLDYMLSNAGKVLTHRALLASIWGRAYENQSESLRVFIAQLRKKIEANPTSPAYLLTEPWVGYRFNPGD